MLKHWKLKDFAPGEGIKLGAFNEQFDAGDWIDVEVPGDVHKALIKAGKIKDPFYDKNELDCVWMEEREWWYRNQFIYKQEPLQLEERLLLIFHGLDTYATIWLNGENLGIHENMFRPAIFDVSRYIHTDRPNTLALCFEPPLEHIKDMKSPSWGFHRAKQVKRNVMRKAQFGYGWDWGPRLPTIGIWRPVELKHQKQAAIKDIHFATDEINSDRSNVLVSIKTEIERFGEDSPLKIAITLISPVDKNPIFKKTINLKNSGKKIINKESISVKQPKLWWTHDLGTPYLYTLQIKLLKDDKELETIEQKVGIRTLKLDQSSDPDEKGTRFFRFVLNGVPIFAKGANWIPADSFVGALTAKRYEQLITAAKHANMNMLRIWGGGIYEHDDFYKICDSIGMLIWQDFMFSCAMYPEDNPIFVEEVRKEVRYQVERLRNHPSLALWCGNNENQMIHYRVDSMAKLEGKKIEHSGLLYYDKIMPKIVKELDGYTPYWPSSPYGGKQPNSIEEGDVHDWHVWHGIPLRDDETEKLKRIYSSGPTPEDVSFIHYTEDMGRFISEFGMHASPVYETLRRCIPADQLYHHSPAMDHHNKDNPKNKGDNLMVTVTGLPRDLKEYIDFSMIAQAEGLKFGIEHFRRRKPHCSGTLIWQFNDCWPVLSWSILDYYGFGKAGYYYVKRTYAPVLASFKAMDNGSAELWITNDTLQEFEDTIVVQLGTFVEGKVWEEQHNVKVPANSSQVVWRGNSQKIIADFEHYLSVRSKRKRFPANRHFFVAIKDLKRPIVPPEIKTTANSKHELSVNIYAPVYVYYIHLTVPDENTHFSDNYFDLAKEENYTVVVTNKKIQLKPDMVSVGWR
jgi:beta-mannosidase